MFLSRVGWGYVGQGQIWDTGGVIRDKGNSSKLVPIEENMMHESKLPNLFLSDMIKVTQF